MSQFKITDQSMTPRKKDTRLTRRRIHKPEDIKGIYYCPIEIIKGLTDKGQFQYLTNLKGPQVGNYLYTTQFLSLR